MSDSWQPLHFARLGILVAQDKDKEGAYLLGDWPLFISGPHDWIENLDEKYAEHDYGTLTINLKNASATYRQVGYTEEYADFELDPELSHKERVK